MVSRRHGLPGCLAVAVIVPLLVGLGLWWLLLSPFGYEVAEESLALDDGPHTVFAYGTLTRPRVRRVVIGRAVEARPARIEHYRRDGLNLVADRGDHADGEALVVSGDELRRLDRYERLGIRYRRELRRLADSETAWVYFRVEDGEALSGEQSDKQ